MAGALRDTGADTTIAPLQIIVPVLCFLIILADGFDTQSAAFAGPLLKRELTNGDAVLGLIFGMGMFGGFVGALLFGSLGDRYGRRPILLIATALIAVGSMATAFSSDATEIALMRFVTGLGLGGAVPNLVSLVAEYAPPRRRITVVAAVFNGFPLGALLGSIISAKLLPLYGWRALFLLGGIAPALIFILALLLLPESLHILRRRGDMRRLDRILARLGPGGRTLLEEPDAGATDRRGSVAHLFHDGLGPSTALIWFATFLSVLVIYCTVNWLPTLISGAGMPLQTALISVGALNIGSVAGSIILARSADRREPYGPTTLFYCAGALCLASVGYSTGSSALMLGVALAAGLFAFGAQLSLTAITARLYSRDIRATGVGWAFGMGRFGGVLGPILAGLLLQSGIDFATLMIIVGLLALSAGATIFLLGHTGHARAEQATRSGLRKAERVMAA